MNIKILQPMKDNLVIATFPFGSRVYGTDTLSSDFDYVKILNQRTGDLVLQYTSDTGRDYVYIGTSEFFNSITDGKSTINFEAAHTQDFKNYFGSVNPMDFYTIKMARAYLGYAKRDLKYPDRVFHINRCLFICDKIMNQELLVLSDISKIPIITDFEVLKQMTIERREKLIQMERKNA